MAGRALGYGTRTRQSPAPLRLVLAVAGLWIGLNLAGVLVAWARAYTAEFGATPATVALDLRRDDAPGRTILIAANRPRPERGDVIGHLWVIWPEAPGPEPTRAFGFYADSQPAAAAALAGALIAPWGFATGAPVVEGGLASDDGEPFERAIAVTVDDAVFSRALDVHRAWSQRTDYRIRPPLDAAPAACQDYVFAIAGALGLAVPARDWTQLPASTFLDLAAANPASAPATRRPR
jgi:hypothetical protein